MRSASNVAVLVGSLRRSAYNRKIAQALTDLAPRSLRLEVVEIARLSLYDPERDTASPPLDWKLFRQQIRAADAVLFLAPECRCAVPAVLRNALEIASRPFADNAWTGKPGGVMCITPTGAAGTCADYRLRQTLVLLNVPVMQPPYACVRESDRLLDAGGRLNDPRARTFLQEFIGAFDNWVHTTSRH